MSLKAGTEYEIKILRVIAQERIIREDEIAILAGIDWITANRVCLRLAKKGQVHREKIAGNPYAGTFVQLAESGAIRLDLAPRERMPISRRWQHQALAIQALHFIWERECWGMGIPLTDLALANFSRRGKRPDGALHDSAEEIFLEQECSRKSGQYMNVQVETVVAKAQKENTTVYISYPFPPQFSGGIDHELRLANAIRDKWGDGDAPNIRLVRNHFDSTLNFENAKPSRFEVIDLPQMKKTGSESQRLLQLHPANQIFGYFWEDKKERTVEGEIILHSTLKTRRTGVEEFVLDMTFFKKRDSSAVGFTEKLSIHEARQMDQFAKFSMPRKEEFEKFVVRWKRQQLAEHDAQWQEWRLEEREREEEQARCEAIWDVGRTF